MPKRIIRPPQRYGFEEDDFSEFISDSGSEDDMDELDWVWAQAWKVQGACMYW